MTRLENVTKITPRWLLAGGIVIAGLACPVPVLAAEVGDIHWFTLCLGLFGGLALFLAGMEQISEGLKKAAGSALKHMLSTLTTNRFMGAITGAAVTGILNSSSITTVLVVGFVTAGLMTLQQSVGVIMGANIGSTVTAQLLAFNISEYALLPVATGFFMLFSSSKDRVRHWGMMIMGIGMVFFGMSIMSQAMYPLRSYQPFLDLLQQMEKPLLGILAGTVFTGLVQSSAATVGIAIAMAGGGLLSLSSGISLALGANIGTCVTALMAAMGKPPEAVRAAVVHVIFNIIGVIIWLPFLSQLGTLAAIISPVSEGLEGAARMAAEVPRQIANANTLFNVINTMLFLPFTGVFAILAKKIVKDRPVPPPIIEPLYLDKSLLDVPSLALAGVRRELVRVANLVLAMFDTFRATLGNASHEELKALVREDDKVDLLESVCIEYLGGIRTRALTEKESIEHQCLMASAITLETLADVIETDLVKLVERAGTLDYQRSEKTRDILNGLYSHVREAIDLVIGIIEEDNAEKARELLALQPALNKLQKELLLRKSERLGMGVGVPNGLVIAKIEVSAADKMMRMYSLCKRIARAHIRGGGGDVR